MIDSDPPKKRRIGSWKIRLVKKFMAANPEALVEDVVKACRTSTSTVLRARRDLIATGELAPAVRGRPPREAAPSPAGLSPEDDAAIRADIEKAVSEGRPPLSREERRQRLSAYAESPRVPTGQKIAALKELEATEPADSGPQLGPGPPLTREDRIHRAALILEALIDIDGPDAVVDATHRATHAVGASHAESNGSATAVVDPPSSEGSAGPIA